MEDLPLQLHLPKTALALKSGDPTHTEQALQSELEGMVNDLMLGVFLDSGGGSDDEWVTVDRVDIRSGTLSAKVVIDFVEQKPTGCKDMMIPEKRRVERRIVMEPDEAYGTVLPDPSDPDGWDVADRNSALDGK